MTDNDVMQIDQEHAVTSLINRKNRGHFLVESTQISLVHKIEGGGGLSYLKLLMANLPELLILSLRLINIKCHSAAIIIQGALIVTMVTQ